MKNTVLTKEALKTINDNCPGDCKYGDVFTAIAEAQAKATWDRCRTETAREIIGLFGKQGGKSKWSHKMIIRQGELKYDEA